MNIEQSQQFLVRQNVATSGEELLAVIGVDACLKPGSLKVSDATLRKAGKLQDQVYKRCRTFLQEKGFEKIKLNLPEIDFLDLQELILETKGTNWTAQKIGDLVDPAMQLYFGNALQKALTYLASIVPKLSVSITSKKTRPSDFELARFNRAYRTVNDPLTILDDMEMGCLSRGQVQTLIAVYPNLYALIQQCLVEAAVELTSKDNEFQTTYPKLKQISVLMLSTTVAQDLQSVMQNNFKSQQAQAQGPQQASEGGASAITIGQQTQSPIEEKLSNV